MSDRDDALREMARNRGLKLVKSRRRKPGGDFGRYGLKDAGGRPVFGFAATGLCASAEAIERYLRQSMRATWTRSAGTIKARKAAPPPPPPPSPPPKTRAKAQPKLDVGNLLRKLPSARRAEAFTELFARPGLKAERIVSRGQATPENAPLTQDRDEWVLVLQGSAGIRIEGSREAELGPGDHLWIKAGQKHWVTWTSRDVPTVWLTLHFG